MKHSPEELRRMSGVMLAAAEGKKIEWNRRADTSTAWGPCEFPIWDWSGYDYRVKPEPMEVEVWVHQSEPGLYIAGLTIATDRDFVKRGWVKRKFREVVEEP